MVMAQISQISSSFLFTDSSVIASGRSGTESPLPWRTGRIADGIFG